MPKLYRIEMNMKDSNTDLAGDIRRVNKIDIVPTLLDVVCQTTGMRFAAIARVTQDRWIACSVRDEIQLGILPGGELKIETTICNEIRDSHQPVVIDHVQENEQFCNHPTPIMYGFQSYISFPIILKSGEFFGTLCALDPKPAKVENATIKGMFMAFADLISFHLQQIELLEQSDQAVKNLSRQLTNTIDENRQYRHASNHSIQEPLRKLRIFSELLVDVVRKNDVGQAEQLALKINAGAERLSLMIKNLSDFSILDAKDTTVELADLNAILASVCTQLSPQLKARNATLHLDVLPSIKGFPFQLEHLFYQLLSNAIKFAKKEVPLVISISYRPVTASEISDQLSAGNRYIEIQIADNGIGIDKSQLEKIFDMFAQLPHNKVREGTGLGLTYCRKIIRNHFGLITIQSEVDQGTTVSVILPF
ncbi:GAF domain-containing protein [Larkinella arboricola]|uniref:histidine kinase n=2 Tax=Larkinella arboricola TaxID=643671 RepID=A0A327WN59_LARAB|nr:GAF domain-containing protein [Larkinella arboricola]